MIYYLTDINTYLYAQSNDRRTRKMPIPIVIAAIAAIAGATGAGGIGYGAKKMKDSSDMQKKAQYRYDQKLKSLEEKNKKTLAQMDALGALELEAVSSFKNFFGLIGAIEDFPEYLELNTENIKMSKDTIKYDSVAIKNASIGASVLIGGLSGAALGTAGGFAAVGATTAAVAALGVASTGTPIAALSGAAATSATLAALGGGSLLAGGAGMLGGTLVLGGAALGVGLLFGGIAFGFVGKSISKKAEQAVCQANAAIRQADKMINHMHTLGEYAVKYTTVLGMLYRLYSQHIDAVERIVNVYGKRSWNGLEEKEKKIIKNCMLLVTLIYNMCTVRFVLPAENNNSVNKINFSDIESTIETTKRILLDNGFIFAAV